MPHDPRADEAAITRLIFSFGTRLDAKDWTGYSETFVPDGIFDIAGHVREGREAIARGPARDLAGYARTHHLLTGVTVDVDGDEATSTAQLLAVHVPDLADLNAHADLGSRYTHRCVRTTEGWRFAHVRLEVLWTAGLELVVDPG